LESTTSITLYFEGWSQSRIWNNSSQTFFR